MSAATLSVFSSARQEHPDVKADGNNRRKDQPCCEPEPDFVEIERLAGRCAHGDVDAWSSLFPVVWPVLVKFIHRLYSSFDHQDAEDVAQLSLEAAVSGIKTFSGRGLFRAWLFGIAAQQARSTFRKRSAAKRGLTLLVPLDDSFERGDERAASPVDALLSAERARIVHRAIDELPDKDRELVHLYYFGELTFSEIALVRNMNAKTVCTRLTRCKAKLLDLLAEANLTTIDG